MRHWLGEGGDLLALRAEHSLLWGIEALPFPTSAAAGGLRLCHSPLRCRGGIWPPAFPTLLAGGALATTGIKLTERYLAPCVFFCTHPFAYKSKLLTLGLSTKKSPQALLESFFPVLR